MKQLRFWTLCFVILTSCVSAPLQGNRYPAQAGTIPLEKLVNKLHPFQSDGCTTFPNSIAYPNPSKWGLCCVQHDIAYWKGGSQENRKNADKQLQACVIEQGEANLASWLYWNVHAKDSNSNSTPWGYGWQMNRGYALHSEDELKQIQTLEKRIPDLSSVKIVPPKALLKHRRSLTDDTCVDASLMFIQNHLQRKFTPLTIQQTVTSSSNDSRFEYTISLMAKECHKPYVFIYSLKTKDSCTKKRNTSGTDIVLQDIDYPAECD
jgi:hypothetical protein